MAAKIHFICTSIHPDPDRIAPGPTITVHDEAWAYCENGGTANHDWRELPEERAVQELGAKSALPELRQG